MATSYDLQEVLAPKVVTQHYREIAGKYKPHPLVEFYSSQIKDLRGDRFEFAYRAAMKTPAPANFRGSPARVLQPTGLSDRKVYMLRAFNEVDLSYDALQMIRRMDDLTLQEKGREEIDRQQEDFGDRHSIFRAVSVAHTFRSGELHFNANGRILETATGASYSVDFGVDATHKTQCNGLIALSWDNAAAKILDQLDDLRIQAQIENAEEPKHIWLHHRMKRHLRTNTQLLGYLQASPEKADRILAGDMIEDLNGWTWHFDSSTYVGMTNTTESTVSYIPTTGAIITPDVGEWLKAANGSELLTGYEGLHAGTNEAIADIYEAFGDFSYVKLVDNPVKLVLRMGTNFVYVFANPAAVWMPTVVF